MMSKTVTGILAAAMLGLFVVPFAIAEDAHHPPAGAQSAQSSQQPPSATPAAPQGQPAPGSTPGGMGMMGQPGAGQPGTASGGMMPMMGMMGQGGMGMGQGGMMGMMGQGGTMGAGPSGATGMSGHHSMMIDRVEGRIAFLRAELKITDAQTTTWGQFADALRANAKKLGQLRESAMQSGTAPVSLTDGLDRQERWLTARLDGVRAIKTTFKSLYDMLSEEQKKTANELVSPHVGMMRMEMM